MSWFNSIRQEYRDLSLHRKFSLILVLAILLPALFVLIFVFPKIEKMVASDTVRKEQDAAALTAPLISDALSQVILASESVASLDFYRHFFYMPVSDSFDMLAESPLLDDFAAGINTIIEESPLTAVRFYLDLPEEEIAPLNKVGDLFSSVRKTNTYWRGIFAGTGDRELFCPPFYLGQKEAAALGDEAYIRSTTFYRQGTARTAYIAFYYSSSLFRDILSSNLVLDGSVSYIVNDRDSIVASSDPSLTGIYYLRYKTIEDSYLSFNTFVERTILDEKVYAGFYSIARPSWYMVIVLPSRPITAQVNRILLQFILIIVTFFIAALLFGTLLSRSITGRISSVIHRMQSVRKGPPVPMDSPTAHDEIGDLIDTYNYMTRRMKQLMEKQAKDAEDLRIAEFNSLQAQINPHFLYNTMDMINWLAQQGQREQVSNAVQNLSRFYRLTLSRKGTMSTIAEEIEHVSIYVHLQNMRYKNGIELIIDVPDELMDRTIPKLTLQPIIENSILHGILEKESRTGTIVVTAWTEKGDVVLLISDDGVGMTPEVLSELLGDKPGSGKGSGFNIAVRNTHRRLAILYGEGYGLRYKSEPGVGTETEIRIPDRGVE